MPSTNEQIQLLNQRVNAIDSRLLAINPNHLFMALLGKYVRFGCKVTEGTDATDMIVALEGQASGDSANLNPLLSATPGFGYEYGNLASTPGGMFAKQDTTATVAAVPATGDGRYDIAYIYAGKDGTGFAIQEGAASAAVKTDFDANGLDTEAYPSSSGFDPSMPVGGVPVARIYVEDDVTGIPDARIADIRVLTSGLYDGVLAAANNLSDLDSVATALGNLGLDTNDDVRFRALGLGAALESWDSAFGALQIGNMSSLLSAISGVAGNSFNIVQNGYYDGAWKYAIADEACRFRLVDGQVRFENAAAGSADAAITWAERLRIDTSGISLDAGSNYLGDYDDAGTFTPVLSDGTYDANSYTTQYGQWVKAGKLVVAHFNCHTSNIGSVSGDIRIRGLPFTCNASIQGSLVAGLVSGFSITSGESVHGYVQANTDYVLVTLSDDAGGTTSLQGSEWSGDGRIIGTAIYKV